jgi:hypothetical protein
MYFIFYTYPHVIHGEFGIEKSLSVPLPAHGFKLNNTVHTLDPHGWVNYSAANALIPAFLWGLSEQIRGSEALFPAFFWGSFKDSELVSFYLHA